MLSREQTPFVSSTQVQRAMRLSIAEGVCWALMVGLAETYFIAAAVRLRASPLELGLVVTLPLWLGAAGPLTALGALRFLRRRKWLVTGAALAQAAVLGTIALLDATGIMTARVLIGCVCVYTAAGQTAGTAWASWFGDLVPRTRRGRYFSRRNRAVQAATAIALVAGGLILELLEPALAGSPTIPDVAGPAVRLAGTGFRVLFLVAMVCRLASAVLLAISPEPTFRGLAGRRGTAHFLRSARGRRARRVILVGALFYGAVYLGAPYFNPYMLSALRFSYIEYMIAAVWLVMVKVVVFPLWGGVLDRRGARLVFVAAMCVVSLVPLPWLLARGLGWVLVAQTVSGIGWSAYEVSYFALLLEASTRKVRPHVFATQSLVNGTMQITGGLVAGLLLENLAVSYRFLFAVTLVGRMIMAALGLALIWQRGAPLVIRRFSLRLTGARPAGGIGYRPIEAADLEPPPVPATRGERGRLSG